jgi:hypothetical protein
MTHLAIREAHAKGGETEWGEQISGAAYNSVAD